MLMDFHETSITGHSFDATIEISITSPVLTSKLHVFAKYLAFMLTDFHKTSKTRIILLRQWK